MEVHKAFLVGPWADTTCCQTPSTISALAGHRSQCPLSAPPGSADARVGKIILARSGREAQGAKKAGTTRDVTWISDSGAAFPELDDQVQGPLVVVGEKGSDWSARGLLVVPGHGGVGKAALQDSSDDTCGAAPAVAFRSSWTLRVSLTASMIWRRRPEQFGLGSGGLVFGGRSDEGDDVVANEGLESALA